MKHVNVGKATVTIEREGEDRIVVEFSELNELSVDHDIVDHDIRTKERPSGLLNYECRLTTITLKGKLVGSKTHEHQWKHDGWEAVKVEAGIEHFGLTCECGARACGNLAAGIVHDVRELPEAQS